ncbi:HNH endonuclease [Pseudomonas aeruginosa]|uniref:HNH endonuclease n=2 Tax=Pseudomonas TaxID=286 RepID=A6VBQ4_PSEP7|nr:HNH endonuclease [Pseudomonas aeruginosa PA7]NQB01229.1 HNH endonuclease [Pseudomonas paraeruginosa]OPD70135.1 HNH endonuclease [Pseudomonas aeruginosa]OPD70514.1 HNH endonuclease [Pseudomonas aeruginosa]
MKPPKRKASSTYLPKARSISLSSAAWRRMRNQVLAEEPLCRMCAARGLVVPATDVDHIQDSRADYSDDNSRANLQPLCHECHSLKTARSMGKSVTLGCDVSGLPVDPAHPWNSERSPETAGLKTAPPQLFDC